MIHDKEALATFLVDRIFAAGDTDHDRTQRIAMKGGQYSTRETDLGGFNRIALIAHLTAALADYERRTP